MNFNPSNFLSNLKYMGVGMLGVFIIIGVIIGATYAIAKYTAPKSKSDKEN